MDERKIVWDDAKNAGKPSAKSAKLSLLYTQNKEKEI